ncbi:MAG: tRNA (mnm(5)s(2)U34)-methyltransferase [Halanaerobium sp.]
MQKNLFNAVEFSHLLAKEYITDGDIAIDATAGNGYDTKFLANLVGDQGKVYSFDIQKKAINNTKSLLQEENLAGRVELILDSHANLDKYINQKVSAVIFNLGYLPGGNKKIITRSKSTKAAIEASIKLLHENGLIILVIYSGHQGGEEEKRAVLELTSALDYKQYNVLNYKFLNQPGPPPEIVAVKKRN